MRFRLSSIVKRTKASAFLVLLAGALLSTSAAISLAQTGSSPPIQVETREVVVPVFVYNKTGVGLDSEILGLTAKNFHVFEDGQEQKVENVSVERLKWWTIHDNFSDHVEYSCTPRGIWVGPDIPQFPFFTFRVTQQSGLHVYLVSYTPPPSREGSCHRIKVKVDHRPKPSVYARDDYCSMKYSVSDSLYGTKIGSQMEGYADSAEDGRIPIFVQMSSLFGTTDTNLIHIAVEFPWRELNHIWSGDNLYTTIGVQGLVYNKSGTLLARFSDAPCYFAGSKPWDWCESCARDKSWVEFHDIPNGYEGQIALSPGDYDLKIVVTDGKKFGRAEVPLKVDKYDPGSLTISGIVLCKRYHEVLARAKQYFPLVSKNLEYTAAGDTRFEKQEPVLAYFQVREPSLGKAAEADVQFEIKVTDEKTGEVEVDTGKRSAESWVQPWNPVISIVEGIIIDKLASGSYRLEVQAIDSAGQKTEWRATSFTVE